MKKSTLYIILTALAWLLNGCNFGDINIDPNKTTDSVTPLKNRLPALEFQYMYLLGGSYAVRVANIMGQTSYKQGPVGYNNYVFGPADANNQNSWADMYATAMLQSKQIADLATEQGNFHYRAIANIIRATAIANISAIWGDVPFSEASDPAKFPLPRFDNQESIYANIQQLLDLAIEDLKSPSTLASPKEDDFIFNGDKDKWTKVAYSLKARYYLHLVKIDVEAYNKASVALENGLKSNVDNAVFGFEAGTAAVQAPLFRERSSGDTEVDGEFGKLLRTTLRDPREKFYTKVTGGLFGTRALYGPFYSSQDSYFPLITYEECAFMKAEIAMKAGNKTLAEQELKNGIAASLNRVCSVQKGTDAEANVAPAISIENQNLYTEQKGAIAALPDTTAWKTIFQQKWIAMFMQVETWNDYRRTENYIPTQKGLPVIVPRGGSLQIPRRMFYPASELNANSNAPSNIANTAERVWWDTP